MPASQERSLHSSSPIELYHFDPGGPNELAVTDAVVEVNFNLAPNQYLPQKGLSRSSTTHGSNRNAGDISVTVPLDFPLLAAYQTVPRTRVRLTVRSAHVDATAGVTPLVITLAETFVSFLGYINEPVWTKDKAEFQCSSALGALRRSTLRRTYQPTCNNMLYDDFCQVDELGTAKDGVTRFQATGTITALLSNFQVQMTLNPLSGPQFPAQWLKAGYIENTSRLNDRVTIASHDSDLSATGHFATTLNSIPTNWLLGDNVVVQAGCPHTLEFCHRKFNNAIKYGGYPYIPRDDPHIRIATDQPAA